MGKKGMLELSNMHEEVSIDTEKVTSKMWGGRF